MGPISSDQVGCAAQAMTVDSRTGTPTLFETKCCIGSDCEAVVFLIILVLASIAVLICSF